MIDFRDQVVIVTGAGRGFGRLYALEFARRGAAVVVNDVGTSSHGVGSDASVAAEVVAEIEELGGTAVASVDSVSDPGAGQAIVDLAKDTYRRVDVVVSNAGIFRTHPFEDMPFADWRRMLEIHLDGSFQLSQAAFRVMKAQGHGRFVMIASSAGMFGQPNSASYAAAKAGIVGLANVIAIEGEAHGILANTVLPFGTSRLMWEMLDSSDPAAEDPFIEAIRPELAVPMVVYLASRSCEFSHRIYSAGGGRFARVFIGLGDGVILPGDDPNAEDVAANIEAISATDPYTIPSSILDEIMQLATRLNLFD